ncbi:hypothetical protein CRENBAI_012715 [Crenichthys baileyi]|uniref:Uncharacterized protein n=1 Tax=Crenichthys baileyi TaxID=28760 RepID=A0AAV9RY99_9TELE
MVNRKLYLFRTTSRGHKIPFSDFKDLQVYAICFIQSNGKIYCLTLSGLPCCMIWAKSKCSCMTYSMHYKSGFSFTTSGLRCCCNRKSFYFAALHRSSLWD